jgi:hypothetical protein
VARVIERYLGEEAEPRGLQSEGQTVHLEGLLAKKRYTRVGEVFAILRETEKRWSE